ncbi:AAA family ATPase [uncultured Sphingomonas sp.]|uniref:AAA family ATPase n=1 Tax=uncultured Sphingomonas sp. TaxID=158754 RepID=UPI0035C9B2CE
MRDPLGRQPRHVTGNAAPDYGDPLLDARVDAANTAFATIWVDHAPQTAVINQLRRYIRQTQSRRGVPIPGRRLSQETQAGKSALVWRLKAELAAERAAAGLAPNEYQVVIITIEKHMTLKAFLQEILKQLGEDDIDPDPEATERKRRKGETETETEKEDRRSYKTLETRIAKWSVRLGVDLIVADEAQRLDRVATDASHVTERIQTFLDRGVVPLLLIGNGKSHAFFEKNGDLCARLGNPLVLKQLLPNDETEAGKEDAGLFKAFCKDLNAKLVATGAVKLSPRLTNHATLDALLAVSSGHVGRVVRLIEEALPLAVERGAATIEAIDLSNAVRGYAIGTGWIDHDPFSHNG